MKAAELLQPIAKLSAKMGANQVGKGMVEGIGVKGENMHSG